MTSNDILPTHKSVPHSRLIREASPCRRWESTQKLRNGKCAASESSGVPRSKRGCFYQAYALKVKGSKQKRSGVRVTEMDCIQFTSSEAADEGKLSYCFNRGSREHGVCADDRCSVTEVAMGEVNNKGKLASFQKI